MTATILEKINHLPEHLQDDVEHYVDFLIRKHFLEDVVISDATKKALDERKKQHQAENNKSLTANQLKEEMRAKYGV
jgi:hypothetical protein